LFLFSTSPNLFLSSAYKRSNSPSLCALHHSHAMKVHSSASYTNFKVSVKFVKFKISESVKRKCKSIKEHGNFYVVRIGTFVYTIFPTVFFINITGIKAQKEINSSITLIRNELGISSEVAFKRIDNITACCKFIDFVGLQNFHKYLLKQPNHYHSCKFNSYIFPSIYLKLQSKGTIVIFNSGKFNIVGLSCEQEITKCLTQISALIDTQF